MTTVDQWRVEEWHSRPDGSGQWVVSELMPSPPDAEWYQKSRWDLFPAITESLIVKVHTETYLSVWGHGDTFHLRRV